MVTNEDQGYKNKESEQKQKELLRDLDVTPGGWGPYCSGLTREQRACLNTREKVKLDVEFRRLEVPCLNSFCLREGWKGAQTTVFFLYMLGLFFLISSGSFEFLVTIILETLHLVELSLSMLASLELCFLKWLKALLKLPLSWHVLFNHKSHYNCYSKVYRRIRLCNK